MICRACGRVIANENANFCEYCGTAVDEHRQSMEQIYFEKNRETNNREENRIEPETGTPGLIGILNGTAGTAKSEGSMSFLHWLVVLLLPYIPMIGGIAYLVLLFVWAFGSTASGTRKSWARATLVTLIIGIVMLGSMLSSLLGEAGIAELMNSMYGGSGV